MSQYDDADRGSAADRLIYDAREQLQAVRREFWRQRVTGTVSPRVKQELAVASLTLYDILWEHRDEQKIRNEWEESHVDQLRELLDETVAVESQTAGDSPNSKTETRPAIMSADADWLLSMSKRLDELAKDLGFGASIASSRPIYHAGKLDTEDYDEPIEDDIPKPQ